MKKNENAMVEFVDAMKDASVLDASGISAAAADKLRVALERLCATLAPGAISHCIEYTRGPSRQTGSSE